MGSTRGFAAEALKVYKPTSPGQRGRITTSRDHLWKGKPLKALTVGLRKKGGRNNQGRITVWHQGGGHKRLYRIIDMKRRATTAAGTVRRIEYDPNRTTRIALVDFLDDAKGTKPCYVLAADGRPSRAPTGNAMPLREIPPGTQILAADGVKPGRVGRRIHRLLHRRRRGHPTGQRHALARDPAGDADTQHRAEARSKHECWPRARSRAACRR